MVDWTSNYKAAMKMQPGEIRKLPKSSSPMFVEQWSYQGSAKAPYIVSRKGGYKGTKFATEAQKTQEWQCSCKSWMTTVLRQNCKHIVAVKLKEGLLKDVTPIDWKPKPDYKNLWKTKPLIAVKPEKGHVVISEEEHEAYKKFLAACGTRKAGNNFDEEGRRFRP
jgi:hypothetical protein